MRGFQKLLGLSICLALGACGQHNPDTAKKNTEAIKDTINKVPTQPATPSILKLKAPAGGFKDDKDSDYKEIYHRWDCEGPLKLAGYITDAPEDDFVQVISFDKEKAHAGCSYTARKGDTLLAFHKDRWRMLKVLKTEKISHPDTDLHLNTIQLLTRILPLIPGNAKAFPRCPEPDYAHFQESMVFKYDARIKITVGCSPDWIRSEFSRLGKAVPENTSQVFSINDNILLAMRIFRPDDEDGKVAYLEAYTPTQTGVILNYYEDW